MSSIIQLERIVRDSSLIESIAVSAADVDRLLGLRDDEIFSSQWMNAFERVESAKARAGQIRGRGPQVTAIREACYLQAFRRWKSADLAACISDDMGLIADAIVEGIDDKWINGLLMQYLRGTFPAGGFQEIGGEIADLLSANGATDGLGTH